MEEKNDIHPEEERIGRILQRTAHKFHRLGEENLSRQDITFSQLRILLFISHEGKKGAVLQKDLEEVFQVRRSSIAGILKNMETSGIISRKESSEDARVKVLALTPKGKLLEENLKSYMQVLEEKMVQGFSQREKELLRDFLFRIASNLDEMKRDLI